MKLPNYFAKKVKTLAVIFAFLVFFLLSPTMAHAETCITEGPVPIENGSFDFSVTHNAPEFTVRSALVSLPEGVSGTIDEIVITGPDGKREFGCVAIEDVKNGTNLINSCGGPAVLKAGKTTYKAKGSGFKPGTDITKFAIKLCDEFS